MTRRDELNQAFFTPGEEFVYYEAGQLGPAIRRILDNFGAYEPVIERATDQRGQIGV